MHRSDKRPIKSGIFKLFIRLMLQKALISIGFFIFMFELDKSFTIAISTNLSINKFISPIPNLKDYLFFCFKACVVAIITRISSYSYFRLIIYHKHFLLAFYDVYENV